MGIRAKTSRDCAKCVITDGDYAWHGSAKICGNGKVFCGEGSYVRRKNESPIFLLFCEDVLFLFLSLFTCGEADRSCNCPCPSSCSCSWGGDYFFICCPPEVTLFSGVFCSPHDESNVAPLSAPPPLQFSLLPFLFFSELNTPILCVTLDL